MAEKNPFMLRLRSLPKPEYKLLKALVKKYQVRDESELVAVALRLLYEVSIYQNGVGEQWIIQVIGSYRDLPEAERVYSV